MEIADININIVECKYKQLQQNPTLSEYKYKHSGM